MLLSDFPISMASAKLVGSFYVLSPNTKSTDLSSYDYDFIIIQSGPVLAENDNQKVFLAKNSSVYYYYNNNISYPYGILKIENDTLSGHSGTKYNPENDTYSIEGITIYLFKYV